MLTEQVMKGILHELPGQTFAFKRMQSLWTPEEAVRFERELEYLTGKYSLQQVIDGYVYLTEATMAERRYFQAHGDYSCHSFAEVDEKYYSVPEVVTRGMLGLCLTEYLWETVLLTHRFFEREIRQAQGENYLEIGPGHGKYFCEAYNLGGFKKYVAVDVSPASIALTAEYMQSHKSNRGGYMHFYARTRRCLTRRRRSTTSSPSRRCWSIWRTRRGCCGRSASC